MQIGNFSEPKIAKTIIHSGTEFKPIKEGAKVKFHFVTRKCDDEKTVIDDSRKLGKPMELVIGKKFKLECWETIVQAMAIHEVASFVVDKSLLHAYPLVSKTLRDAKNPDKSRNRHCCGQMAYALEYKDLNELMRKTENLEFIIELLSVEEPGEYEQDTWQLTEADRLQEVPKLREEGNALYRLGKYAEAAEKYSRAIGFLDQLMLCEKPNEIEWKELNSKRLPILLNYAQCKLSLGDYYDVIKHCDTITEYEPENVKAVFRRAKAHMAVWNKEEAQRDLELLPKLDPSLQSTVNSMLKELAEMNKQTETEIKMKLQGKLF
ncbi:FKBP-type peptidyl-prolyl cis-trans isomerase [Nesidiocoris tenuis]|uniref:FKBP-type peptidyl-prolyl cis-trans isomerase n=1 Tax=Nesidiocoris tenuis TaxID=355587 RepID=A0ABN7AT19_9HEMI|nr:FKBP-type peptidyl-prolyl cis-trans isomerase [Nesidiocoris tenuis]